MSNQLEPGHFFLPGPTEVHPDVLAAQTGPMIGHRGQAIKDLFGSIEEGLQHVFQTQRPVIVSTSSATGLMEAAVRNGVGSGKILALVTGAFSKRFAAIAQQCGKDVDVWEVEWGTAHDPLKVAQRLNETSYEAVTLSQSETSTGVLQDLEAIAAATGEHPETMLLVDSVTGIGGVETYTDEWGIDFILTGSQKALALPPGLAFGVASEAMLERASTIEDRGWYFDLVDLHNQIEGFQTPATPAVSLLYALDLQMNRIVEETMPRRWQRHLDMQARTFDWTREVKAQGVDVDIYAQEGHRSPTVTCLATDRAVEVTAEMRRRGWVIGGGYGKIKAETIRIGHMGDHTVEELNALLAVLADVLA